VTGQLLAIAVDGTTRWVECSYEGMKDGLNGATISFLVVDEHIGLWIDDNGMLENQPLNVVASLMAGRALYGPAVVSAAEPDDEGDTLPAPERSTIVARGLANCWLSVWQDGERMNQDLVIRPNPDSLPPPTIMAWGW
jgi:hypothetical protein